jgi:hypothetical protein
MNSAHKPSGDDAWLDLVVALLAVNQYSVDKAYALAGDLRKTGLTDPRKLAKWSTTEIEAKLMAAGYERGAFMNALFSERLAALGRLWPNVDSLSAPRSSLGRAGRPLSDC